MSNFYFFTDPALLNSQGAAQAFGPAGVLAAKDQFHVTDLHTSSAADIPAVAICDGVLCAQEDDQGTLTLILKPSQAPPFEAPVVSYFIYKGVAKTSLLNGDQILDETASKATDFTKKSRPNGRSRTRIIWLVHERPSVSIATPASYMSTARARSIFSRTTIPSIDFLVTRTRPCSCPPSLPATSSVLSKVAAASKSYCVGWVTNRSLSLREARTARFLLCRWRPITMAHRGWRMTMPSSRIGMRRSRCSPLWTLVPSSVRSYRPNSKRNRETAPAGSKAATSIRRSCRNSRTGILPGSTSATTTATPTIYSAFMMTRSASSRTTMRARRTTSIIELDRLLKRVFS